MYNFDGSVKHCIRNPETLGSLVEKNIHDIVCGSQAIQNKTSMRQGTGCNSCHVCHDLEQEKNSFDIISDRVFYLKELKTVNSSVYDHPENFELNKTDIRWSNVCNFACIYCWPEFSSKWATELEVTIQTPPEERVQELKQWVLANTTNLKHVYLAGGEPLLMKENQELLLALREQNPGVNIRVNTNLSKVDTKVFDLLCGFKNVHWTVSVEAIEDEYEYIRYGGKWSDFLDNLAVIQKLNHKISFNMLHFMLNYVSIFDCIDFLSGMGFHNNSFIVGPLLTPDYLNIRHLPEHMLNSLKSILDKRIAKSSGFLLEDGLRNMQQYINTPVDKHIEMSLQRIQVLDQRRGLDSRKVFSKFYKSLGE